MINKRTAIVIEIDEESAVTLLKPFSGEHHNQLFVITEDAYGNISGKLEKINDIRKTTNYTSEEFDEFLKQL